MLCLENGLSVIAEPKPSRGSYGTWLGEGKVDFLHFCLNVDQQIRLGLRRRLCPGSDDPLTENALHDRRSGTLIPSV